MSADIECPRCHRINMGFEAGHSCKECHWRLRVAEVREPYGFDVLVEVRKTNLQTETQERHYKGTEATAKRRARMVPGFVRVLATVPLSRETWLNCYGEGKI